MVDQMEKGYTMITLGGVEIPVVPMSKEDIEREMEGFEAKYGMSSVEFAAKWNDGELDCAVMDYFDWAWYCGYMSRKAGIEAMEIIHTNVQELKIE